MFLTYCQSLEPSGNRFKQTLRPGDTEIINVRRQGVPKESCEQGRNLPTRQEIALFSESGCRKLREISMKHQRSRRKSASAVIFDHRRTSPASLPPPFERLSGKLPTRLAWVELVQDFGNCFAKVVGHPETIRTTCSRISGVPHRMRPGVRVIYSF